MFIAVQLTVAKLWNQPRCPSMDEWITKLQYIHTVEFYSAIKKNKITPFAGKWMDLENMLSEDSQSRKPSRCMFSYVWKQVTCFIRDFIR